MKFFILCVFIAALLPAQNHSAQIQEEYQLQPDSRRDAWQKPDQVIGALHFSAAETVAVIENGYPYFAPRIAPHVSKVYAVNSDPRVFQGRGAIRSGISPILSNNNDPKLSGLNVDTIVMVDLLQSIPQPPAYYRQLTGGLKAGGRVIVIDRRLPAAHPLAQKLNEPAIRSALTAAGLTFAQQLTIVRYQYCLIFKF
jgi:hypothetical protein